MENVKFSAPLTTVFELDNLAEKRGRSRSEIVRHLVDRGLGMTPEAEMPEEVSVDRKERASGARATACYLSLPISAAIQRLAREEDRSASWLIRRILRDELRRRGLLPTPVDQRSRRGT